MDEQRQAMGERHRGQFDFTHHAQYRPHVDLEQIQMGAAKAMKHPPSSSSQGLPALNLA